MPVNPELRFETGSVPMRANGAWLQRRAIVASTDNTAGEQRGAPAAAVSQHATFTNIEKFLGISPVAVADGAMGELIVKGRTRVVGGGVITAGDYVIWGATGKFTSFTLDASKFAYLAGIAATDCSGDDAEFDLWLNPILIAPATDSTVDMTLSGTLTAADVVVTDDITAGGRVLHNQGADVASANNLVLGGDGNVFEITGTTQINLLSNLTWQNGAVVTLLFTSTPTVKHAQVTSTTNITILLMGAADFVAAAGDSLTLVLSEIGGTQAWREVARKGQISTTGIVATTGAFSGNVTASARVLHKQGADVASTTNLVLGSDGNVFEITGTTKIDLISNLTWQNGAEVTLYFTGVVVVDHGTATSTTNITILLDGATDFTSAAGDMLKLTLCEIGGTQAWRESGRMTVA